MSIPSVSPLRAYVYDNIVLRLCREPYQQDLSNAVSGPCVWGCPLGWSARLTGYRRPCCCLHLLALLIC